MYLRRGEIEKAIPVLEGGWRAAEDGQVHILVSRISSVLGGAYAAAGRTADALVLLEQAAHESPPPMRWDHSLDLVRLGELYLLLGRSEASDCAMRALNLARAVGERGNEAWALRLCGEIAASADASEVDQAKDHYSQALTLAEELGMRPLAAHCHFGLGKLYRKLGCPEQAQTQLSAGIEMYRAMGMTFWLEKALAVDAQVLT
jgi:tetratricopeptide (TPR) repeat protein